MNSNQILNEGKNQCHCVGIYAREAVSGEYAVFAIHGPERATLGVLIEKDK